MSPDRDIEFRRLTQACEFEQLRKKFGSDEIRTWTEYREIKRGVDFLVVSPFLYDANPLVRAMNDATGSNRGKQRSFLTKQVTKTNANSSMCSETIMKSVNKSTKPALKKTHSGFHLLKKLTANTNVA